MGIMPGACAYRAPARLQGEGISGSTLLKRDRASGGVAYCWCCWFAIVIEGVGHTPAEVGTPASVAGLAVFVAPYTMRSGWNRVCRWVLGSCWWCHTACCGMAPPS